MSSYSYMILPTGADDSKMTTAKRQTLADFLYYSICDGQKEMGPIGYSPLPINLVQAGFDQIGKLKQADPGVDLTQRDVSTCNNPTFIAGQPDRNYLAEIAPQPPPCDGSGQGPCNDTEAGPGTNGPTAPGGGGGGGNSGSSTQAQQEAVAASNSSTAATAAAATGEQQVALGASGRAAGLDLTTSPSRYKSSSTPGYVVLFVILLLVAIVVTPSVLIRSFARRTRSEPR